MLTQCKELGRLYKQEPSLTIHYNLANTPLLPITKSLLTLSFFSFLFFAEYIVLCSAESPELLFFSFNRALSFKASYRKNTYFSNAALEGVCFLQVNLQKR